MKKSVPSMVDSFICPIILITQKIHNHSPFMVTGIPIWIDGDAVKSVPSGILAGGTAYNHIQRICEAVRGTVGVVDAMK